MCRKIVTLVLSIMIISSMFTGCRKEQEANDEQEEVHNTFEKSTFGDNKHKELKDKDIGYDLVTKTYTEKTKNMEVTIKYPVIINMANKEVENKSNKMIVERMGVYDEPIETDDEAFKETLQGDYEITRKTKRQLSIKFSNIAYMEGATHPTSHIDAVTFDLKTGELLGIKHLFRQDIDYKNRLNNVLNEKVNELDFKLFDEYKGIEENQGFYLTENRLVVYYQEGVYTPHAIGPLFLEVSFDEMKDILK
ncbi:DUF3298 and DUF4163 domain-containing protein [Crassaminicella profunda]|uniref:DUF3298 and DUF4163 domain-containing protein n=1 Tax=Crassaminicella profunda TaxID=1286698 RepID=UPI001CA60974|nr:DUF3298 and DUF4163 domain-containing protein [Crassaminicella profunda]QZY54093.1 DUF3298 and DUF4163 domain-containing protein [Crassaminicella profunda]